MKFMSLAVGLLVLVLSACSMGPPSAIQQQQRQQEQIEKESNMQVGMPAITNFSEKRDLKQIYELRDQEIPTTTYIVDLNGKVHKLCDSVGFGIPYATEYTNPDLMAASPYGGHYHVMPQADPNGLYSPPDAEGTWILCLNPQTKKSAPLYVEPRVIVSPFPLQGVEWSPPRKSDESHDLQPRLEPPPCSKAQCDAHPPQVVPLARDERMHGTGVA